MADLLSAASRPSFQIKAVEVKGLDIPANQTPSPARLFPPEPGLPSKEQSRTHRKSQHMSPQGLHSRGTQDSGNSRLSPVSFWHVIFSCPLESTSAGWGHLSPLYPCPHFTDEDHHLQAQAVGSTTGGGGRDAGTGPCSETDLQ